MSENEQTTLLREILKWTRFAGMKEVKAVLTSTLDSDKKKAAYQASDGKRSTRDVASIAGFGSKSTVADLWKVWKKLGLGETSLAMGGGDRFKRSFDLDEFGIEFPKIQTQPTQLTQLGSDTTDAKNPESSSENGEKQ
jgi:hypothetical protein